MLSISTCWNSTRHSDGASMLGELLDCGFEWIELGHGIRATLLPGIQEMVDAGKARISSLHNFCPLPVEITQPAPDCLKYSSPNEAERERAVRQTLQTINIAVRLGAPLVVLHCGRVEMRPITKQLLAMARQGRHLSPEYVRAKLAAVRRREKLAPRYLERSRDALRKIIDYAEKKGVRLGLESRYYYEEIPTPREITALLEEFPSPAAGYWHDFGHIQVQQNLGFVDHAEWLQKMAPRLLGCHLHDVAWPGGDHRPPFTGGSVESVDYDILVPLLPKNCLFVWEMNQRRNRKEIEASLAQWKSRFGE